jgi:hypothetical protein
MNYIIIGLLILILVIINFYSISEKFSNFIPFFMDHTNLPWWNSRRTTRNMSYDLRGDPLIIQPRQFIWNNSNLTT